MANAHDTFLYAPEVAAPAPATDEGRLDAFLRTQSKALVAFLRARSYSEEDAQDTAQEALARFARHYAGRPVDEWQPVLYRIAVNAANDRLRLLRRRAADQHVPLEAVEIEDERQDAEQAAADAQYDAMLAEAVLALPERCRQVYLLARVRGMDTAEVARLCGISQRMVQKQLANALQHVWRRFAKDPSDAL
ncbi:RNA polymerase sigma factor [Pseudoxanthomonas suwonensis]|uniref:RNA polymerase sigma factor n=1 Tax=Pseudoxanthomonas suwonensis TaxID=314722 RepID=UPI000696FCB8|nr:sigma-70 family RNA polymerase sigma factor [Pseudoxanthomonas suwonensis]